MILIQIPILLTPEIVKIWHDITGNLNVIPDSRVRFIISKGLLFSFPSYIYFPKCRREIAASLNDFSNCWCKREDVKPDALKEWKINIV